MMGVATLLKAQALSLTKHIRIKTPNLSVPVPELMFCYVSYLLGLCGNYKCKATKCLAVNSRSQIFWLWFQQKNNPGISNVCP